MTQQASYPQSLAIAPPVSLHQYQAGHQIQALFGQGHLHKENSSLYEQVKEITGSSVSTENHQFVHPCLNLPLSDRPANFNASPQSHFSAQAPLPMQRCHSAITSRPSGRYTPLAGTSTAPLHDNLLGQYDGLPRGHSGSDSIYGKGTNQGVPSNSSSTLTSGPAGSLNYHFISMSNACGLSSAPDMIPSSGAGKGGNKQSSNDGYSFSGKGETSNGQHNYYHQYRAPQNHICPDRHGTGVSNQDTGHLLESRNGELNFKNEGDMYNGEAHSQQGSATIDLINYVGESFTTTKQYRSFSSELNSPDLPLPEDIDMDFGFPLGLDFAESGFDNFMSNHRHPTTNSVTGSITGNNRHCSKSIHTTSHQHNLSYSSNNSSSGPANLMSDVTRLTKLKQESQDLSDVNTCSSTYSTPAYSGVFSPDISMKNENLDCQFDPHSQVGTQPSGYLMSGHSYSRQSWSSRNTNSHLSDLLSSSKPHTSSVFTSGNHSGSLTNAMKSLFSELGSGDLFRNSDESFQLGSVRSEETPALSPHSEKSSPLFSSSYILAYLNNTDEDVNDSEEAHQFPNKNNNKQHVDNECSKRSWMSSCNLSKSEMDSGLGWGLDNQYGGHYTGLLGASSLNESYARYDSEGDYGINRGDFCNVLGASPKSRSDISSSTSANQSASCLNINGGSVCDSLDSNLVPATVKLNSTWTVVNHSSGWQAVVRLLQQHKSCTEAQDYPERLELLNTALDHILQNRPTVNCIPSARDLFNCSYRKPKTSKLLQEKLSKNKDNGTEGIDERTMKKRKIGKGSPDEVSTTTSTPSPLAPCSSSSPPAPHAGVPGCTASSLLARATALPSSNNDSTANVTSSSKPEKRRPSVLPPCRVCCSKASGLHYGVVTCEACNGFFRRSLKRGAIYLCSKEKNCDVRGKKRGECSHCRYQKCVTVGMSKSAVKTGRYSDKTRLAYAIETENQNKANQFMKELTGNGSLPSDVMNMREAQVNSSTLMPHFEILDKGNKLTKRRNCMAANSDSLSPALSVYEKLVQESPTAMWSTTSNEVTLSKMKAGVLEKWLRHYLKFAKKVPGFSILHINDQITLIRASWHKAWLLSLHSGFSADTSGSPTDNKSHHNEVKALFGKSCADLSSRLWKQLEELRMTCEELTLMKMVSLTDPQSQRLEGPEQVQALHWLMTQCLIREMEKNHPDEPNTSSEVSCLLSELRRAPHLNFLPSNGFKLRHSLSHETPILHEIMTSSLS